MPLATEVLVIGLGAMGSCTLAALARRGVPAIGIDRFAPPHTEGSSHGASRIIREAYYEDPAYVPLVREAYTEWARLAAESGRTLLHQTGGLCYGPSDGPLVRGALTSARTHDVAHELLDAREIHHRFPAHRLPAHYVGVLEHRAGWLDPEACLTAALQVAVRHGARVRTHEQVLRIAPGSDGVRVTTDAATYDAARVVVSAGMWMGELVPTLGVPLSVQRHVLYWFMPAGSGSRASIGPSRPGSAFDPAHFPVFLGEVAPDQLWYGFPDVGAGVKVAMHHQGATCTPGTVDRVVQAGEVTAMRDRLAQWLPPANGRLQRTAVCTYTNTPDGHFLIDTHPESDRCWIVSPCSGHGFKFASAIGARVAAVVAGEASPPFPALFRRDRF
ncbi:MAG: N-methyl-L-tryptophan oxidase [Gemmatimonadaceae bacterium]|jgi:sarcosine oxidase